MLTRREFLKVSGAVALSTELSKSDRLSLDTDFGAVGDGATDDSGPLAKALASGQPLSGNGKTYAVSGDFTLPDDADLEHITLKQLSRNNPLRRTLVKTSGSGPIKLRRVKIDKNGATTDGSIADAAGIWIANINDITLEDVEVTGNSKGTGVILVSCNRIKVVRPYIHDMRWSNGTDPRSEQIVGLWMNGCTEWLIEEPMIRNLDGVVGARAPRPYQTDGITVSGSSLWRIAGGTIKNCGEGIDVTGTEGNSRFSITATQAIDIDSYGFKFANSASQGVVTGTIARDCGFMGHVVSGASEAGLPKCEDITFIRCKSISTGSNGNWAAGITAGFAVLTSRFDTDWPQAITFVECEALDEQRPPTMKYGFRSEPAMSAATARPNRMVNCHSRGHAVAKTLGAIRGL